MEPTELNVRIFELKELPEVLHLSPPTISKLIRSGRIRCIRVGRRVLVPAAAVEAFLGDLDDR